MSGHISLITLGVEDIARATSFYERLGFKLSKASSEGAISFFQAGPVVLALFGRDALAQDAATHALWTGNGGVTLAQNVGSEAEVDAMMALAEDAGAHILKAPAKTFWGGYDGYFADPDGNVWEVAHNPFWQLAADGSVTLPD